MSEKKQYITRKAMEHALATDAPGFSVFLNFCNNDELRPVQVKVAGGWFRAFDLDQACSFLRKFTYKFTPDAESELRAAAFAGV